MPDCVGMLVTKLPLRVDPPSFCDLVGAQFAGLAMLLFGAIAAFGWLKTVMVFDGVSATRMVEAVYMMVVVSVYGISIRSNKK